MPYEFDFAPTGSAEKYQQLLSDQNLWNPAKQFRVVAIDHRGHGRGIRSGRRFRLSDCADDAAQVLDLLGTGPVVAAAVFAALLAASGAKETGHARSAAPAAAGRVAAEAIAYARGQLGIPTHMNYMVVDELFDPGDTRAIT